MAKTYEQIKSALYGRRFDIDGAFGAQCWDGYAQYEKELGYPYANCTATGYVRDIWELRNSNGMLNNHIEVTVMQAGDIAVFKPAPATPYSHIAIFDHDAGNGYGWFLGQNQGGTNGAFNLCKIPYSATYDTAFRPKCFVNNKKPAEAKATGEAIDQILHVGSYVTSKVMKIGNQGLKKVGNSDCCYLAELGGWFPIEYVDEADASDGRKDNYLANTNAHVVVTRCVVQQVNKAKNLVMIHGIWVNAEPLIEVK